MHVQTKLKAYTTETSHQLLIAKQLVLRLNHSFKIFHDFPASHRAQMFSVNS
jgi:hypothetical protein